LRHLPETLRKRCRNLTGLQRERLATSPFLLFSFHEHDGEFWARLFDAGPNGQLFESPGDGNRDWSRLLDTTLGFVWQLARDNTYAARVICGASLYWCEQLADRPLLEIVAAAARPDLLTLRSQDDELLWRKLLFSGVAGEASIREAAHLSALQRLLTENHDMATAQNRRAASRVRRPLMKVADDDDN